jgi:hypothetical protein
MKNPNRKSYSRSRKLIRPGLQLKLVLWFLAVTGVGLLFEFVLFGSAMSQVVLQLGDDAGVNYNLLSDSLMRVLVISLGVTLPMTVLVGILATFRIAGPVHALATYLEAVRDGHPTGPCQLRSGDELRELCDLVNEVTDGQRKDPRPAAGGDQGAAGPERRVA